MFVSERITCSNIANSLCSSDSRGPELLSDLWEETRLRETEVRGGERKGKGGGGGK